jgi:hypothetical protein
MPDTPTPAELLRAAAELIRERLMPATEAPWTRWTEQESVPGWDGFIVIGDDSELGGEECNPVARFYTEEDARWALLMHPGVGEPIARLLIAASNDFAMVEQINSRDPHNDGKTRIMPNHLAEWALAVARAVLGGAS